MNVFNLSSKSALRASAPSLLRQSGGFSSAALPTEQNFLAAGATFNQAGKKARASSDPGGTLATARSLGSFPGKRSMRNTVGRQDKDFYQIVLSDVSDLRLTLSNRSAATVSGSLLNSQGQVLSAATNSKMKRVSAKKEAKGIYRELAAGTYYLRVQSQQDGQHSYRLSLSAANTFPDFPDCGCDSTNP